MDYRQETFLVPTQEQDTNNMALLREHANAVWAITSYFNPANYASRLRNYRIFRKNLIVPLVTVELSLNGEFQLCSGDADVLIQLLGGNHLWQKERLLNVALRSLPADCECVAWIDCDVVFESSDWPLAAVEALEQRPLIQLFAKRCDLRGNGYVVGDGTTPFNFDESAGWKVERGAADSGELHATLTRDAPTGLAWAARRELLLQHGLYDACILGGGDRSILCAALGKFDQCAEALRMGPRQIEHYRTWAEPFYKTVTGNVGCIEGRLFHLWHGDLRNRRYRERHESFQRFSFDPFIDVATDSNGCWRWSTDKADMHEYVRNYFHSRKEDD